MTSSTVKNIVYNKLNSYMEGMNEYFNGKSLCKVYKGEYNSIYNKFKDICLKVTFYLHKIQRDEISGATYAGCLYVYYWIYYNIFKDNHFNYIKNMYDHFLNASGYRQDDSCIYYKEYITEDVLRKLKYTLYSSYIKQTVRNLLSLRNKKNGKQNKLYSLFEKKYKNITGSNYNLLYNSVDYKEYINKY
ncbi:variable surface protein [Plasmodium gonderi]|uniref:Variable surface protein n=1 Tax=Plasmodium gonderi TaxID=77519 RepID=A0A1Y1JR27_PLAGO|nr:variable surface protein [Plasmodium gonderi]GAW83938.1 variable surface protein [Plasmodium gonderi]